MAVKKSYSYYSLFTTEIIPESSYLLGLLWADGFLSTLENHYNIAIEIAQDDMQIIEHIFDKTGIWLNYIRKRNINWKTTHRKHLSDIQLWTFLSNNDYLFKTGSSPNKILSIIPNDLQYYWWRGYFDGDGTVGKYTRSRKVGFTACYEQDWSFFYDLCYQFNIKYGFIQGSSKGKHSKVHIQNKDGISKFFNYIYPNGYDFGFKRKYDKFLTTLH